MEKNYEKIQEIENLQNMIFDNSKNASPVNTNSNGNINPTEFNYFSSSSTKLNEHGHFVHNFGEYKIRAFEVIPLYFIKHHNDSDDNESNVFNSNTIPVITNITRKDKDSIEITRVYLYNDYHNKKPYSTERILIKRNPTNLKDEVFLSYFEDKLKKVITTIKSGGDYSTVVKFKKFRNPNELLFFQNIFYYRCVLDTYIYYKYLQKIPPKKEFNMSDMTYNEFLKNLF